MPCWSMLTSLVTIVTSATFIAAVLGGPGEGTGGMDGGGGPAGGSGGDGGGGGADGGCDGFKSGGGGVGGKSCQSCTGSLTDVVGASHTVAEITPECRKYSSWVLKLSDSGSVSTVTLYVNKVR